MKNNKKVAFYGSLRKGHYNYDRFKQQYGNEFNYIKTTNISGFNLFDLGSYPGLKAARNNENKVIVDIFELSEKAFDSVERMEHGAGYSTIKVVDDETGEKVYCYLYEYPCNNLVESGDWSKYLSHKQFLEV